MAKKRLYHQIADEIVKLIDEGVFPPGSRLPGERDLAERFAVSRVAIREAEIALQAQGRLEIKAGSGSYVVDPDDLPVNGLPKSGPFELTEARALFEGESAALAAPIISDEALEELEGYIDIMSGRKEGNMSPEEADAAFHLTIARSTNNQVIEFVVTSMWKMRTETSHFQNVYKDICDQNTFRESEHRDILDALKRRNSSEARNAMRAHFTRMIDALLVASEEEAYQEVKRKASESRSRYMLAKQLR